MTSIHHLHINNINYFFFNLNCVSLQVCRCYWRNPLSLLFLIPFHSFILFSKKKHESKLIVYNVLLQYFSNFAGARLQ